MLQKEAENTLMELTAGLDAPKPLVRTSKRIPLTAAKAAGFIEAGSDMFMSVDSKDLGTKEGSFWQVKAGNDGQQVLERVGEEFELNEDEGVTAASSAPDFFSTTTDMYEWFQENGGSVVDAGSGKYSASTADGQTCTYTDGNNGVVKEGSDHTEELQRRASNGNEPPIRTIPEQVELDTTNKYQEQGKERELSLSEQSDKTLLEEDLKTKGLSGLEFD